MDKKQKKLLSRILAAAVLFALLLLAAHVGLLAHLPQWAELCLYLIPYLLIGWDVLVRAARNICRGNVFEEHFLMSVATIAAFALGAFGEGAYPEALAVMLFYQVGELFQSCAVGASRRSITELVALAPEYAVKLTEGKAETVDPEDVHIGDTILVRPGEKIPLDGIVALGESYVDTAALTGEASPRRAGVGDTVHSGFVCGSTPLEIRVTKEYEDSAVMQILTLVEEAGTKKARMEGFITRFARYYTPIVTGGAVLLAALVPLLYHVSFAEGIRRACNFLIVSCPCALVISVPLGFFGGIGAAAKRGILVKGADYLEAAARLSVMVMDKTGTLTKGEFCVTKVLPAADGFSDRVILEMAAHGEGQSTHPIARSILAAYGKPIDLGKVDTCTETAGQGIEAAYLGKQLLVGNAKLMERHKINFVQTKESGTAVYIAYDGTYLGCLMIEDSIKEGAKEAIEDMKKAGIRRTVMLTGDNQAAAEAVAARVGIEETHAYLLPADKVHIMEKMADGGGTIGFVGDGINDAPVLMRADVGFSMGALGSDAAIEAADIVLMDDDIRKIPALVRLARKTVSIVRTNVVFALAVKGIILLLSAAGYVGMWAAVFGDVGVSILCILNAMRTLYGKKPCVLTRILPGKFAGKI